MISSLTSSRISSGWTSSLHWVIAHAYSHDRPEPIYDKETVFRILRGIVHCSNPEKQMDVS